MPPLWKKQQKKLPVKLVVRQQKLRAALQQLAVVLRKFLKREKRLKNPRKA